MFHTNNIGKKIPFKLCFTFNAVSFWSLLYKMNINITTTPKFPQYLCIWKNNQPAKAKTHHNLYSCQSEFIECQTECMFRVQRIHLSRIWNVSVLQFKCLFTFWYLFICAQRWSNTNVEGVTIIIFPIDIVHMLKLWGLQIIDQNCDCLLSLIY